VSEVGKRRSPPEVQRGAKQLCGEFGRRFVGLLDQPLETEEIELIRLNPDQVARFLRDYRLARRKHLAQPRDVVLESVQGALWRPRSPELVDQSIGRDHLVRAGQQQSKQRPLPCPAEREMAAIVDDLQGSQDPELHHSS
jgi:hypothetical protein